MVLNRLQILITAMTLVRYQDCTLFISTNSTTTWYDAKQECKNLQMNLAGTLAFYNNHTGLYEPGVLSQGYQLSHLRFPAWINGYSKRTMWISQNECYVVTEENLEKFHKRFILHPNGPAQCSFKCNEDSFGLQKDVCVCLSTGSKLALSTPVSVTSCREPCSGDNSYYCGATSNSGSYSYLSIYNSLYLSHKFPDGRNCLATSVDTNGAIAKNCQEKLNCFCKNHVGSLVFQSLDESWDRCSEQCRGYGGQVVTIDVSNKASLPLQYNVWYWSGYFRFDFQIWDKDIENDFGELKGCLAIKRNGANYTFVSKACNASLNAICSKSEKAIITKIKTSTMTLWNNSDTNVDRKKRTTEKMNLGLTIGIIVGGVITLSIITVVIVFICKRRYRCIGSTCRRRRKHIPVAPHFSALDRHHRGGSGRHIYTYIDPRDIMSMRTGNAYVTQPTDVNPGESVPLQNIYETPDLDDNSRVPSILKNKYETSETNFNSEVIVDDSGYLEPRQSRLPIQTNPVPSEKDEEHTDRNSQNTQQDKTIVSNDKEINHEICESSADNTVTSDTSPVRNIDKLNTYV